MDRNKQEVSGYLEREKTWRFGRVDIIKGHGITFESDEYIHYLDYDFTCVCICQNLSDFILKHMQFIFIVSQKYVSKCSRYDWRHARGLLTSW